MDKTPYEVYGVLTEWPNKHYRECKCTDRNYKWNCDKCPLPLRIKSTYNWCRVFRKHQQIEKEQGYFIKSKTLKPEEVCL